jgi:RHS repeat-associated protein
MLIEATVPAGSGGTAPTFTDDPLNPNGTKTDIKLVHLTQLREAVDQLRARVGLSAGSYTKDPSPTQNVTEVHHDHIMQLREALEPALSALHLPTGGYAHGTIHNGDPIYAIDFQELRDQIKAAWSLKINWMVTDQLGTPRMIFDLSGSLATVSRHDYLPFGEELFAGTGGRTTAQGYTLSDNVRQKFTQKERDSETGLNWFDSRYYASVQGRFTSPDHFEGNPAHLYTDFERSPALPYSSLLAPQTFNAYAYVYNEPLSNVDPDGHQGGKKIPLPGKPRYQIRADTRNPNDAPNIHVFDKGGRREIGRVSIKPGGNEWSGKVPESVKTAVEKLITDRGIEPRLPGAQPRPRASGGGPDLEGLGGTTRVLRGTSNVVSVLALITGLLDIATQSQQAQQFGYHFNQSGQMVITDLAKAAQNFPAHYVLEVDGHYFVPKGNTFVPIDGCSCELEQDKEGKVRAVWKME